MRIMIASSTYHPAMNGQAVFTTNLAEGMVRLGHTVKVVVDSRHVQASQRVLNGVSIDELPSVSMKIFHSGVYFSPLPGKHIRRLMSSFQPDIVHIQDHYPSCLAAARIAHRQGTKIVGSNHFIPENLAPYIPLLPRIKPLFDWIMWYWVMLTYKNVDLITAQSVAAADLMRKQGLASPILPISCGIDLQRFYPNPSENRQQYCQQYGLDASKLIFLFLGRIDGEKRVDLLVHAIQQLDRNDIQLAIAGHGKVERNLQRLVADMGLQDKVRFTGFIPSEDVPGLMNSIDVFVMPSEAELLSISTLEAMACGRPVLLAEALALPELVKDGLNGHLFRPGDVEDLVTMMKVMADHPERWGEMGKASREIALQHSLDDTIRKYESLYIHLINKIPVVELTPPIKEIA